MTRPGFRSVVRARVLERVIQACSFPIALIVAPAGYGKSVALRQYLDTLDEPYLRFDVRPEHNTLSAFVRGFAESLHPIAPQISASLPDALRGTPSADELASWLIAHLEGYRGLIAIDDLHYATDRDIMEFLLALLPRVKDRIHWLIASRSVPELPIASWIAYGDMDIPVDERDLAFTVEETRVASYGSDAGEDELSQFVEMTGGWATALSFALRSRIRTNDLAAVGATTREMVYRYLAEQVYDRLDARDREMLHVAAYLPEIDVELLVAAGFSDALAMLERLRSSAAFLSSESPGRYRCHDLFRDFLRHRVQMMGHEISRHLRLRVADLLLGAGQMIAALAEYAALRSEPGILRVLELSGFELIDKCHHDLIDVSLAALSEEVRLKNATILALRGIRESQNSQYGHGEKLLVEAMGRRHGDSVFRAQMALRLATVLNNQQRDVSNVLSGLDVDMLPSALRGEIASYLALAHIRAARPDSAREAMDQAERLSAAIDEDPSWCRVLHRLGAVAFEMEDSGLKASGLFTQAHELAERQGLYVTSSAALGGLAVTALFWDNDILSYKRYSEQSLIAAQKSGDRFSVAIALSRIAYAESVVGNFQRVDAIMHQVSKLPRNGWPVSSYMQTVISIKLASEGHFHEAYDRCSHSVAFFNFNEVYARALQAIYAVAGGRREEAIALVGKNLVQIRDQCFAFPYGKSEAELARLMCAFVELIAGRSVAARRILRCAPIGNGSAVSALRGFVEGLINSRGAYHRNKVAPLLQALRDSGRADLAVILDGALSRTSLDADAEDSLTDAERRVLLAIDNGLSPKEIAVETGRSIHTVRTLIQRATAKLGCNGRQQAIVEARRRGLLRSPYGEGASSASA